MCQILNLSLRIVVQNVGCVFAYVADTDIICSHNFLATLNFKYKYFYFKKVMAQGMTDVV